MPDRPPYYVPTMAEVNAVPPNGYKVASLFAGGGGSSLGYRMAGYRIAYANEFVPAALDTYRANANPTTVLDGTDIRAVTGQQILDATGLAVGELDVLDGSPPCASFSTAGRRSEHWGEVTRYSDTSQRTDDLFYEFIRILTETQPRVFVAENVSGLVKGVAKGYFKAILTAMRAAGYQVAARVVDASYLGVPQARQRVIFVGVRNDLGIQPVHPTPLPYRYTVREVLPFLTAQAEDNGYEVEAKMRATDRPSPTVGATPGSGNGRAPASIVRDSRADFAARGMAAHETSGQFSVGTITDRPCVTVTTVDNHFTVSDPTLTVWRDGDAYDPETGAKITMTSGPLRVKYPDLPLRKFTLAELRIICSFPPDFALTGTYAQRWERLGRSVPPLMMRAIASTIREQVLDPCAG